MGSWSANQDHGDWQAGSIYNLDMLDKGMTHAPGGMTQDSKRVHRNTQKCEQLKTYNFFLWNFSFKTLRLSLNSDSWNYQKKYWYVVHVSGMLSFSVLWVPNVSYIGFVFDFIF